MLGTYLYWICTAALVLCLYLSLMRRQTVRELAEARRKLLDERQEREQIRAELVHAHSTAEKDVAAAKKQATEAKAAIAEIEEQKSKIEQERDAFRDERDVLDVELEELRTSLKDRTEAEQSAKEKIAFLETQVSAARDGQDKLGAVGRELQAAHARIEALEKKVEAESRLRKAAEDERTVAKSTVTTLEGKHRDAERAKAALVDAHAREVQALRAASSSVETELNDAKERLVKAQEELATERSKVQTAAPASSAGGGDVLAALEADPYLNRGQKETIRMTYNQFTAKRRSS